MRLLNVYTEKLETFFDDRIPDYAILSHTWDDEEVVFEDMMSDTPTYRQKKGYQKVQYTINQARRERWMEVGYVWIDTLCIDKSSSAELSEAINSMFKWYNNAKVCYVYLSDVSPEITVLEDLPPDGHIDSFGWEGFRQSPLMNCRWFTRGWTLQELIAPQTVKFYGSGWNYLGTGQSLKRLLSQITGVPVQVLDGIDKRYHLDSLSIAKRMSWAADRQTTRLEDRAYCMLGIFDVNMPMLYGEGEKAFIRLQEEIIQRSDDQSIFVWERTGRDLLDRQYVNHFLALRPSFFRQSKSVVRCRLDITTEPHVITNQGLRINLPLASSVENGAQYSVAVLACRYEFDMNGYIGILLDQGADGMYRTNNFEGKKRLVTVDIDMSSALYTTIIMSPTHHPRSRGQSKFHEDYTTAQYQIQFLPTSESVDIYYYYPSLYWDTAMKVLTFPSGAKSVKRRDVAAIEISYQLVPYYIVFGFDYSIHKAWVVILPQESYSIKEICGIAKQRPQTMRHRVTDLEFNHQIEGSIESRFIAGDEVQFVLIEAKSLS